MHKICLLFLLIINSIILFEELNISRYSNKKINPYTYKANDGYDQERKKSFRVINFFESKKKKEEKFLKDFREALLSMANSLKTGSSLQNSIERVRDELAERDFNKDSELVSEFSKIINQIKYGGSITEALLDFSNRVGLEEVDSFVNAAVITERTGGNLSEVMINTCNMISEKIAIKREITSITAGKRTESKILSIAPIVFVPILSMLAPSYLEPMYSTFIGKIFMVFACILLSLNYFIAKKIMDVRL